MTQAVSAEIPAPQGKIVHDRPPMLAIGVMIWLGSELMFFSGLFAAFFTIRANTVGPGRRRAPTRHRPGRDLHPDPGLVELHHAVRRVPRRSGAAAGRPGSGSSARSSWARPSWATRSTSGSSAHPLVHQRLRLALLHHVGPPRPARLHRPGRHGLPPRAASGRQGGDPGELSAVQGVSYYWHFVDIVWVGLYSCLFLLK